VYVSVCMDVYGCVWSVVCSGVCMSECVTDGPHAWPQHLDSQGPYKPEELSKARGCPYHIFIVAPFILFFAKQV